MICAALQMFRMRWIISEGN